MINTERLELRPFKVEDTEFLYKLNNNKEVNEFRPRKSVSLEYCEQSIKDWNDRYSDGLLNVYLMEIKSTNEKIGLVGIFKLDENSEAELGYRLLPDYWKKGYCSEAVKTLVDAYFINTNEKLIFAETHPENINSIRFLESNGFTEKEHMLKDRGKFFYIRKVLLDITDVI